MHDRLLVPIGVFIALIVVALIAASSPPSTVHVESESISSATSSVEPASSVDMPSPAPAERRIVDRSSQLAVRIVSNGELVPSKGILRFGAPGHKPQEVVIDKGLGVTVYEFLPWLLSESVEAWYFLDSTLPTRIISISDRSTIESDQPLALDFELGSEHVATVEVTDFHGVAIEGARIELEGAGGAGFVTSDAAGRWTGKVFGDRPISIVVRAIGYGNGVSTLESSLPGALSCELQLGRYLAAAIVADSREVASFRYQTQEQYLHSSRTNSFTSALEDSERRIKLEEHERVKWTVFLEKNWSADDRLEVLKVDPQGSLPNQSLSLPLLHVIDHQLTPVRFPDTWDRILAPVDVEMLGLDESAVLPEKVQLMWSRIGRDGSDFPQYGYRASDSGASLFRFYLEPGTYSISSAGAGPTGLRSADAPEIQALDGVEVSAAVVPPPRVRVNVEEGVFYAGYIVVDGSGVPVSLAWQIERAELDMSNRILIVVPSPEPKYRFFNSSEKYRLLMAPRGSGALRATDVLWSASNRLGAQLIEIPTSLNSEKQH